MLGAWSASWFIAQGRNSPNETSTIGRRPNSAAPIATPAMADSLIGASRTRRGPNSSYSPRAPDIAPPNGPMSWPIRNTSGSRRISSAIPSTSASTNVIRRVSAATVVMAASRVHTHRVELFQSRRRVLLGGRERGLHLVLHSAAHLGGLLRAHDARIAQPRFEQRDRVARRPRD